MQYSTLQVWAQGEINGKKIFIYLFIIYFGMTKILSIQNIHPYNTPLLLHPGS